MKLIYNIFLSFFIILTVGCEEEISSNSPSGIELESTLNESSISEINGDIDEYFYDLSSSAAYNSDFYYYTGLSILQPINFDEAEDILNYSAVTDHVLEFTPSQFDESMITLEEFDETQNGVCSSITEDCPDLNEDGSITEGGEDGLYRFEEIKFSHTYVGVGFLSWDLDEGRYSVQSPPSEAYTIEDCGGCDAITLLCEGEDDWDPGIGGEYCAKPNGDPDTGRIHNRDATIYLGDPDKCVSIGANEDKCKDFIKEYDYCEWVDSECRFRSDALVYEDKYDSLVYIADINYNDLNGFTYTDCNDAGTICEGDPSWDDSMGDGQWTLGEDNTLDNQIYSEYYFDQTELSLKDSVYTSIDTSFIKSFSFNKWVLGTDSLIFKISTDCNDNGQKDLAEATITQSECLNIGFWNEDELYCDRGNGVQDPGEPWIDINPEEDPDHGVYNLGEDYLDRNCNGRRDGAEGIISSECPITIIDGLDTLTTGYWTGTFCDLGNFQKDAEEECIDGASSCEISDLYEMGSQLKPATMMASWDSENNTWVEQERMVVDEGALPGPSDNDTTYVSAGTGFRYIYKNDSITPRWFDESYQLIVEASQEVIKTKQISLVDSVRAVYSYPFIENMIAEESVDYNIFKTSWYDSDGRQANYFLNRKAENGDIVSLEHDSYFSLPVTTPGANIDGGDYSNYLVFDEFPIERTYLYTYGGMLRDGEFHQTYRQGYSPETFAYYDIYETYEVSHESVILPLDTVLDDIFPDSEYQLDDVFKITRTRKTVMLGPDLEIVEENKVWLAKGIGIVKDEVSFRFNEPDDFDGYYKLELSNCNYCDEMSFTDRSGLFDNRIEVDFNTMNSVDTYDDQYKKVRTYGLQAFPLNLEGWGGN